MLRQEGRFNEALDLARRYRRDLLEPTPAGVPRPVAISRPRCCSTGAVPGLGGPLRFDREVHLGIRGFLRRWRETGSGPGPMADALASMGDTIRLSAFGRLGSDSCRGQRVCPGRAAPLSHPRPAPPHRGSYSFEAAQAFEKAMGSPSDGFSRTNHEPAGAWLRLKPAQGTLFLCCNRPFREASKVGTCI